MKELIQELKRSDSNILFIIHNKSDYYTFIILNEILISEGLNVKLINTYYEGLSSASALVYRSAQYAFRITNGHLKMIKCRTDFKNPIIDLKISIREYKINKILND